MSQGSPLSKEELWLALSQPDEDDQSCVNCVFNWSPDNQFECNHCFYVIGWPDPGEHEDNEKDYWKWNRKHEVD